MYRYCTLLVQKWYTVVPVLLVDLDLLVNYRVFGYLGIVSRAWKEKERELRIHHGNVISSQPVYL